MWTHATPLWLHGKYNLHYTSILLIWKGANFSQRQRPGENLLKRRATPRARADASSGTALTARRWTWTATAETLSSLSRWIARSSRVWLNVIMSVASFDNSPNS